MHYLCQQPIVVGIHLKIRYNNTQKIIKKTLLLALLTSLMLSSCATMFNGSKETIYLRSEVPNTKFYANERFLGTGTSAVVTLPKKKLSKTTLRSEKAGYHSKVQPVETTFDATCLLGILLDYGIISVICVDWLGTGAVTKAAQTDYLMTPEPQR